jgi:hypothetical protein
MGCQCAHVQADDDARASVGARPMGPFGTLPDSQFETVRGVLQTSPKRRVRASGALRWRCAGCSRAARTAMGARVRIVEQPSTQGGEQEAVQKKVAAITAAHLFGNSQRNYLVYNRQRCEGHDKLWATN